MGASGEPSGYYPMDSSGVMVQNELSAPCKCPVFTPTALPVCPPLGYGGCEGGRCEETGSAVFVMAFGGCVPQVSFPSWVVDLTSCLARCKELDDRCRRNADRDYETAKLGCQSEHSWCVYDCKSRIPPGNPNLEPCLALCKAKLDTCLANAAQAYKEALNRCDALYDTCRDQCYEKFPPKEREAPKNK